MTDFFRAFFPRRTSAAPSLPQRFCLRHFLAAAAAPTILLSLLAVTSVRCQDFGEITGVVRDSLLEVPVGGVLVTALPQGVTVTTDSQGRFRLSRLTPGVMSVRCESAFIASKQWEGILLREGMSIDLSLWVRTTTIELPTQTITSSRSVSPGSVLYSRVQIAASSARTLGDFLAQTGVQLESDGRTQYASLRGFSPQGVLILLDGVPLNPDGGAADLSTIPIESIERIEVVKTGGSARFGANGLGGAVSVTTRRPLLISDPAVQVSFQRGSFDQTAAATTADAQLLGAAVALSYDYSQQTNDYSYTHPYLGELQRRNNFRRTYSLFASLRPRRWQRLSAIIQQANSHSGLPGAIFQETTGATLAKRENLLLAANYDASALRVGVALRQIGQYFRDREAYLPYEKDYLQILRRFHVDWSPSVASWFEPHVGGEVAGETFFNDDLVTPGRSLPQGRRRTESFVSGIRLSPAYRWLAGLLEGNWRLDRIDDKSHAAPYLGAAVRTRQPFVLGVQASYAESYRLPPLDALFWRDDVFVESNPDLKSETAATRDLGFFFRHEAPIIFEFRNTWFSSRLAEMIVWRRQFDGKYRPVNLDRARHSGTEFEIKLATHNHRLELSYTRNTLNAVNESTGSGYAGNTIPFKPNRTERLTVSALLKRLRMDYSYSFTGERYIREANSKALPGFALHDLILEYTLAVGPTSSTIRLAAYNLFDQRYELLERMPMPPRSLALSYRIAI